MKLGPYIAVILAATIAGTSGVFIKLLGFPATSITFFRVFVPFLVLGAYFLWKRLNPFHGNYKVMLFASALNAIRLLLYFVAYLYTTIANAVIILFTWPIFATLFSIISLKEKVSKRTILLMAMAFLGLVIMYLEKGINFSDKDFLGMAAMLVSAVIYAITILMFKKELKSYNEYETIFYQNIIGAILFLPFIVINEPSPTFTQAWVACIYAILVGIVSFSLYFSSLKRMKVSHYSLLTYLEIPASLIFGLIFFKESITISMVVGGSLIVLASLLLSKERL